MRLDPGGGDDLKDGWGVLLRVTCESCWMCAKGLQLCVGIIIVNALSGGLFIRVCDVFLFFDTCFEQRVSDHRHRVTKTAQGQ